MKPKTTPNPPNMPSMLGIDPNATPTDIDEQGHRLAMALMRFEHQALYAEKIEIRNAAGKEFAHILSHLIKHQTSKSNLSNNARRIWEKNQGFKAEWKSLGSQGKRIYPHHKTLAQFVWNIVDEVAPNEIHQLVAEDMLKADRQVTRGAMPDELGRLVEVSPKRRNHFRKWATPLIPKLSKMKADYTKASITDRGQILCELRSTLRDLPKKHFASYWADLIVPVLEPIFRHPTTNPLRNDPSRKDPDYPKSYRWSKHCDRMKGILQGRV
jgi:hypothetical protein